MRRILAASAAVLLASLLVIASPAAPAGAGPVQHYAAVDLNTLNGAYPAAYALNDWDEVVGIVDHRPFLWRDGTMIGIEGTADWVAALDINERGQVVGGGVGGGAFLWERGVTIPLRSGDDVAYTAVAINNRGQVVGTFYPSDDGMPHGYLWQRGTLTDLGEIQPVDINDRGQILVSGPQTAIWANGRLTDLSGVGNPVAINNLGWVVGTTVLEDYSLRAVLWRNGRTTQLGTLGGTRDEATAINDLGQVLGTSTTADGYVHPVLWRNGRTIDLVPGGIVLQTLPSQASIGGVTGLNNRGHITANVPRPSDWASIATLFR
jgi:probable HAF family extracellular repeat protein